MRCETAFVATMRDEAYIAAMKRLKLDTTSWQTGDAVEKLVVEAFSLSPELLQKAKSRHRAALISPGDFSR